MAITYDTYSQAEICVLGALLTDAENCAPEIMLTVKPNDFLSAELRDVFKAVIALYNEDSPINVVTVSSRMGSDSESFVFGIAERAYRPQDFRGYVDAMLRAAKLTRAAEIAERVVFDAKMGVAPEELLKSAAGLVDALSNGTDRRTYTMNEMLAGYFGGLGHEKNFLDWGFPKLNESALTEMTSYVVLAARPSVGKTALALQLGTMFAGQGLRVNFVSYETSQDKAVSRVLAEESMTELSVVKRGMPSQQELANLLRAKKKLLDLPFQHIEASGMTADDIRYAAIRNRANVVIVDYIQCVEHADKRLNEYQRVTEVSRSLQKMAKQLKIVVIALSQLSRDVGDHEQPDARHLRASGQIEQDADTIIFMHIPANPEGETPEEREDSDNRRVLTIAKNRDGRKGHIRLWFNGAIQQFSQEWDNWYRSPVRQMRDRDARLKTLPDKNQLSLTESDKGESL